MMKVFSAAFNYSGICQMANNDFFFHTASKACPWCLDAPVLKGSSLENFQSCTETDKSVFKGYLMTFLFISS